MAAPGRSSELLTPLTERGELPTLQMANIVVQVASTVDATPAHGPVRRDVKPSNILPTAIAGRANPAYRTRLRILLCEHAWIGWASGVT
ncbi:MAG: hypothetical protein ACRDTG_17215 [Pseudonocardiaceae bacterium]